MSRENPTINYLESEAFDKRHELGKSTRMALHEAICEGKVSFTHETIKAIIAWGMGLPEFEKNTTRENHERRRRTELFLREVFEMLSLLKMEDQLLGLTAVALESDYLEHNYFKGQFMQLGHISNETQSELRKLFYAHAEKKQKAMEAKEKAAEEGGVPEGA